MAQEYEQGAPRERRGIATPAEYGTSVQNSRDGITNISEPVVQIQPPPSRIRYQSLEDHHLNRDLFRVKDDENCPCYIMSYLNDHAERIDKPVKAYNHYSLLVYVCNITCVTLLGFPLAFPFMICAVISAKSVRNLNEQNDYVSARVCSSCVWLSLFMTVLMSMASWTCIALIFYYRSYTSVIFAIVLVGLQFLVVLCGSYCVPLFLHTAKIIKTSREMKNDVKAMMA